VKTTTTSALREKLVVFSSAAVQRTIERLAHQILEPNGASDRLMLIGIRRGGENLRRTGVTVPVGFLNINLYRDDEARRDLPDSDIVESVTGMELVLIDDVLFTGRTVRAALDALIDRGRPSAIRLCVLVVRGIRDLPIQADYVGRFVPTSRAERIVVDLRPEPSESDRVIICERP
jgi:pyrimidine operon attenuation protein/uracil phosphoribosyltransferase